MEHSGHSWNWHWKHLEKRRLGHSVGPTYQLCHSLSGIMGPFLNFLSAKGVCVSPGLGPFVHRYMAALLLIGKFHPAGGRFQVVSSAGFWLGLALRRLWWEGRRVGGRQKQGSCSAPPSGAVSRADVSLWFSLLLRKWPWPQAMYPHLPLSSLVVFLLWLICAASISCFTCPWL